VQPATVVEDLDVVGHGEAGPGPAREVRGETSRSSTLVRMWGAICQPTTIRGPGPLEAKVQSGGPGRRRFFHLERSRRGQGPSWR
jgi:hypothetical protein